jgi:hypothetical protein
LEENNHRVKWLTERGAILAASVFAIIIIIGGVILFQTGQPEKGNTLWDGIPENAAILLSFRDVSLFGKEITTLELEGNLPEFSFVQKGLLPLLRYSDSLLSPVFPGEQVLISFHREGKENTGILFHLLPKREHWQKKFRSFLSRRFQDNNISTRRLGFVKIYDITVPGENISFTAIPVRGHLFISNSPVLAENALFCLQKKKSLSENKTLKKAINAAGKSVNISLFVHHLFLGEFFQLLCPSLDPEKLVLIQHLAEWSVMDVFVRNQTMFFSGILFSNDSLGATGNYFVKQRPREPFLLRYFPSGTKSFMTFSFDTISDFFHKDFLHSDNQKGREAHKNTLKALAQTYGKDLEQLFGEIAGHHAAMCIVGDSATGLTENVFHFLEVRDQSAAERSLALLKRSGKESAILPEKTIRTEDGSSFRIYLSEIPFLTRYIFGLPVGKSENSYFTVINNAIVWGNSPSALASLANDYVQQRTLFYQARFNGFYEQFDTAGVLFAWLRYPTSSAVVQTDRRSGNIGIQLTSTGGNLYANAIVQIKPVSEYKPMDTIWKLSIDNALIVKVFQVINHITKLEELLVLCQDNTLALLSSSGKILWKVRLSDTPVGQIRQIDFYRNGKLQYLIFSRTAMYLIDRNGKQVEKFPVQLPSAARNDPVVFDYEQKRDYRIVYNGTDGKIYCLDKYGKQVKGWISPAQPLHAIGPIQYFTSGTLDYLAVPTEEGWIFLNRRGGVRMQPQCSFVPSANPLFLWKRATGDQFIGTDTMGIVYFIKPNGQCNKDTISSGNKNHGFLFSDINRDGMNEMVFVLGDSVFIQSVGSGKRLFFKGDGSVISNVLPYKNPAGEVFLGVWSDEKDLLWIVNSEGTVLKGFPLGCSALPVFLPPVDVGQKFRLIAVQNNFLCNFIVQ